MVKHTQTIHWLLQTNFLSVFDHFVRLALKGVISCRVSIMKLSCKNSTAWKVSKYGVFSSLYFPVFGLNTGKYEPEKTPFLDTFHAASHIFSKYARDMFIYVSQWWVVNMYQRHLTEIKIQTFAKGLDFSNTSKHLQIEIL